MIHIAPRIAINSIIYFSFIVDGILTVIPEVGFQNGQKLHIYGHLKLLHNEKKCSMTDLILHKKVRVCYFYENNFIIRKSRLKIRNKKIP